MRTKIPSSTTYFWILHRETLYMYYVNGEQIYKRHTCTSVCVLGVKGNMSQVTATYDSLGNIIREMD